MNNRVEYFGYSLINATYILYFSLSGSVEFEVTERGKSCSDLGKASINDQEICKNAAKQLGMTYFGVYDARYCPKGCCYFSMWDKYYVWSSISETEDLGEWAGQICSVSGKSITFLKNSLSIDYKGKFWENITQVEYYNIFVFSRLGLQAQMDSGEWRGKGYEQRWK